MEEVKRMVGALQELRCVVEVVPEQPFEFVTVTANVPLVEILIVAVVPPVLQLYVVNAAVLPSISDPPEQYVLILVTAITGAEAA